MTEKPARSWGSLLGLALLGLGGCGSADGSPDVPRSTVRDSAGVRIVENEAPDPDSRLPWTVASSPSLVIGALEGERPYQLFGVEDVMRLPDGRILVANSGSSEIRVFDDGGVYVEAWGQAGQGPGEFVSLTDVMPWPGDSVMAWDFGQFRLTLYDGRGELGRTLNPTLGTVLGAGTAVGVFPDATILMAGRVPWAGQDPVTGLVRRSRDYALVDAAGERVVSLGPLPDEEYFVAGPRFAIIRHPFRRLNHTAVWGRHAVVTPSDRFEVRAYDRGGALAVIVRREHTLETVRQSHVDAWVEERLSAADPSEEAVLRELFDGFPLVPTFPAFSQLLVDSTGDLWIKEYVAPGEEGSVWTVFDAEGHARGLVETPPGLRIFEIGVDYMLGISTGDLDVEQVQMWSLTRNADDGTGLR